MSCKSRKINKKNKYLSLKQLFFSAFYISAFTFGGGWVIVPLFKKCFVEDLAVVDENDMYNMIALAQSAPGPVSVNTAIMLGYRLQKIRGVFVALLGTILPPLIILSVTYYIYEYLNTSRVFKVMMQGLQIAVFAEIVSVFWSMLKPYFRSFDLFALILFVSCLLADRLLHLNLIWILVICIICCFVEAFFYAKFGHSKHTPIKSQEDK